jgi:hypothetical protein
VLPRDRGDRVRVVGPGRLDELVGNIGGEEGFADGRLLHEVEDVRRVAPELDTPDGFDLSAQATPGGPPQVLVAPGIDGAQRLCQRQAHRLVDHQAVVGQRDERQLAQPLDDRIELVRFEDCGQQGARGPPQHRDRLQRSARVGILDAIQEARGQGADDLVRLHGWCTRSHAVDRRGRREAQRQRVAPGEGADPLRDVSRDVLAHQQGVRGNVVQGTKARHVQQATPARGQRPAVSRRRPTEQHHPDMVGKRRDEDLPQPRVDQPEALIVVERQGEPATKIQKRLYGRLDGRQLPRQPLAKRVQHAAWRGLDRFAVEPQQPRT